MSQSDKKGKIAIVGSGLIGQIWSMIFAGAGHTVTIYDIYPEQIAKALENVKVTLKKYEGQGCLRGELSADDQVKLISGSSSLQECMEGADYVQECVPESLDLKRKVFIQLDQYITDGMVVATSSSCICVSQFASDLKHRHRCVVAHPVNPPYFIPLVEIVPADFTAPDVVSRTRTLMESIGQSSVTLSRESPGFALNRIQLACLNECWSMYKSGLLSASDIDKVMVDGLGPRYAFIGPLETIHLNADGVVDYCHRYAQGAYNVSETLAPPPVLYDIPTAEKIQSEMSAKCPVAEVVNRRKWRDERLAALAMLKKQFKEKVE